MLRKSPAPAILKAFIVFISLFVLSRVNAWPNLMDRYLAKTMKMMNHIKPDVAECAAKRAQLLVRTKLPVLDV